MQLLERAAVRYADWTFDHLPNDYVEYCIIAGINTNVGIKSHAYDRSFKKYVAIGETLYFISYFNPLARPFHFIGPVGIFPAAAPAYWWGRATDDMADGDYPLPDGINSFKQYIEVSKGNIKDGCKQVRKGFTIDFLLKQALQKLERVQTNRDNVREDLSLFLDAMLVEHSRRVNYAVLSQEELEQLYDQSFGHAHNIMLIALRSKTRAHDIPEIF